MPLRLVCGGGSVQGVSGSCGHRVHMVGRGPVLSLRCFWGWDAGEKLIFVYLLVRVH